MAGRKHPSELPHRRARVAFPVPMSGVSATDEVVADGILATDEEVAGDVPRLALVALLLGLQRSRRFENLLGVHEWLRDGLPARSLTHFVDRLGETRRDPALEAALGVSMRTVQRLMAVPVRPLNLEQSGKLFKFAEILARATEVLGSEDEAKAWLSRPAVGLDQKRPIDLLATPAGVELVETLLTRLEYGVYT
jgi:putative toxin-antitoxin system antitoxin component (TIGR02293 family)